MKKPGWKVKFSFFLILLSVLLYIVHFAIFHDFHHIIIYLIGDIAFLPLDVLLVTLILHSVLEMREKKAMLRKLNMVIGAFFSEVGTGLLKAFGEFDPRRQELAAAIKTTGNLAEVNLQDVKRRIALFDFTAEATKGNLEGLKAFLVERRRFILDLLGNPNLLEHESFTELLWAVFHLTEELALREDMTALPPSDLKHLSGDISRVYRLLVLEWLDYMSHLKASYPYLFSLAVRTNPFETGGSVVVT